MGQVVTRSHENLSALSSRLNQRNSTQVRESNEYSTNRRPVTIFGSATPVPNNLEPLPNAPNQPTPGATSLNYQQYQTNIIYAEAQYPFQAIDDSEISFNPGDYFKILNTIGFHEGNDWCNALNLQNNKEGLIPRKYVRTVRQIETEPWFFGKMSRENAERLLLADNSSQGTFLVRISETNANYLAISLRDNSATGEKTVKHFKVKISSTGRFYIVIHESYPTLKALIEHHKVYPTNVSCLLQRPCPKKPPVVNHCPPTLPPRPTYSRVVKRPRVPSTIAPPPPIHVIEPEEDVFSEASAEPFPPFPPMHSQTIDMSNYDPPPTPPMRSYKIHGRPPTPESPTDESPKPLPVAAARRITQRQENDSIQLVQILGDGFFGDVWKGIWKGEEVTLMIIKYGDGIYRT
ncbi:tyrosine-protein kinase yes-like [Cloeon dipterum]|uniref:tyrosine-protein kinase yes-like n=1 Tax=Cloeon dipterum TaxID=197152 RepID=UPI00322027AB